MKKITFLNLLFVLCAFYGFGQTPVTVNDFESGDGLTDVGGGISTAVVANPDTSGSNTTANCLRLGRTGAEWWILAGIDVNDLTISDKETKFLSVWVYGPKTDLGCRFDATADTGNNGTNGGIIRPSILHSGTSGWEQIIFPIVDSQTATNFTKGTLFKLVFHPDIADAGIVPGGQMLNNTDTFLYVDEIQILDSNPLSTSDFELSKNIALYPNPVKSQFRLQTKNGIQISKVAVYNALGAKVAVNPVLGSDKYDMSNLASGMYLVKISDDKGAVITKRLLKQ